MDFNFDFDYIRTQKLLMIPQLKQAIDILGMDLLELLDYIEDQMGFNQALEKTLDEEQDEITEYITERLGDEQDTLLADIPVETLSLKEHLLNQLNGMSQDKIGYFIGEYLIDSTDDNGYVTADTSEIAVFLDVPENKVLSVLADLQRFDPPGICARNLQECLILQLQQLDTKDEDAVLVVKDYIDELASDDAKSVALALNLPIERVRSIFSSVRSLEPKPGREFYKHEVERPVIPDILIRETNEEIEVLYNDEMFPEICVSDSFTHKIAASDANESENYIHDKVKNAVWFIKCLEQRKNILTSIAQKLCDMEENFFKTGPNDLIVIDRSNFAALMDMHESILDKALDKKYLQCRWGIFELKAFFSDAELNDQGIDDTVHFL